MHGVTRTFRALGYSHAAPNRNSQSCNADAGASYSPVAVVAGTQQQTQLSGALLSLLLLLYVQQKPKTKRQNASTLFPSEIRKASTSTIGRHSQGQKLHSPRSIVPCWCGS